MYHFADTQAHIASLGQRAAALTADVVAVFAVILVAYSLTVLGQTESPTGLVRSLTLANLLVFPAFLAYFTILEGLWGETLGKRLVGIRVASIRTRSPMPGEGESPGGAAPGVGLYDAFLRNLLRFLWMIPLLAGDGLSLIIGVLMLAIDVMVLHRSEFDQRIGDTAASTIVVVK
ncbi:MAG: RDD family protein [Euryarchaeota archaeon]|nr:RDD family protein [Euryarchaeota archaeon]